MSLFSGVVDLHASKWDDDHPVDSLVSRVIFNNLEHLADESAQVLVNSPSVTTGSGIVRTTNTDYFTTIKSWGPLSIRVRDDGSSYRIRWRMRVRLQSAGSAEIYVVLHPSGTSPEDHILSGFEQNWDQFTQTSTTIGWAAPDNGHALYMTAGNVADGTRRRSTPREIGGDLMDVTTHEALLSVVSAETASALAIEINGFYAAEYVGL